VKKYRTARQATDDNMAYEHCILNILSLQTHSKYGILNAFPLRKYLGERGSALRFTYFTFIFLCWFSVQYSYYETTSSPWSFYYAKFYLFI